MKESPYLRITSPKMDQEAPVILHREQARNLLEICSKSRVQVLPWLSLDLFVGVRPEDGRGPP